MGGKSRPQADPIEQLTKQVNRSFQTLNDNQIKLGEIFNERKEALERAFVLVDAHQHVTRRILNDMYWGRVRPTPLHPDDVEVMEENGGYLPWQGMYMKIAGQEVDYEWYYEQYNLHRAIIVAFLSLRKFLGLEDEEEQPPEEPQEPENDFDFGGDYEQSSFNGDASQADPG